MEWDFECGVGHQETKEPSPLGGDVVCVERRKRYMEPKDQRLCYKCGACDSHMYTAKGL